MPTIHEDRNINRNTDPHRRTEFGTGPIILASLAALAIVFGLFFMMSDRNPTVASNVNRPAVTTPAITTGSGATTIPNNPNGTTPQRDTNQPAPAPANR